MSTEISDPSRTVGDVIRKSLRSARACVCIRIYSKGFKFKFVVISLKKNQILSITDKQTSRPTSSLV